jgi:ABC-type dipeptide/oligopeptide/nickel transport system permease component
MLAFPKLSDSEIAALATYVNAGGLGWLISQGIICFRTDISILTTGAVLLWLAIGIPVGMISAIKRGTVFDRTAVGTALLFASTPVFFLGLVLGAALLVYAGRFWRWPFGAPWWAFTFPLDALAYAAARYAQDHPSPLWRATAAVTLALATFFVFLVLVRTLRSAASRRG